MTYKNKKTGAVIHTTGKVNGENWELVEKSMSSQSGGRGRNRGQKKERADLGEGE